MILGVAIGKGSWSHLAAPSGATLGAGAAGFGAGAFILSMVAMLWAYEGWNNITFTAGGITKPQRHLPPSFVLGLTLATLIYVRLNPVSLYATTARDRASTGPTRAGGLPRALAPPAT